MDLVDSATLAGMATSVAALDALVVEAGPALAVDLRDLDPGDPDAPNDPRAAACRRALAALATVPVVVVAVSPGPPSRPPVPPRPVATTPAAATTATAVDGPAAEADVVVEDREAAAAVVAAVERRPLAASALVLHLRASEHLPVDAAIVAESATYSLLQAGPEHRGWLEGRPAARSRPDGGTRVRTGRHGHTFHVTLARPAVRNAVDAAMQQALTDALVAAADAAPSADMPGAPARVMLDGEGPSFSSGGDLGEFGTLADPASAHLVRVARSPGRALARIADRVTAVVHGACYGAGVELPAFASRVVARPGTTFTLPELSLGLVPGAGGTVSLPRRIGRRRTAWLALTGHTLRLDDALAWGLVDEVAG